jgi:hypothetical protein
MINVPPAIAKGLRDPWIAGPAVILVAALIFAAVSSALTNGEQPDESRSVAPVAPTATPEPTPSVATPTPDPGALIRDAARRADLDRVAAALEAYYADNGMYPPNGGLLETLCAFPPRDAGCALQPYIDPIPEDIVRGGIGGYWYRSDGHYYELWAWMEATSEGSDCADEPTPPELRFADIVYCKRGGQVPEATP